MHPPLRPTTVRARIALLAGSVTAAVTAAWLASADLPPAPPLAHPTDWGDWSRSAEPLDLAAAVLRPVAVVAAGYLALAVVAALVAAASGRGQRMAARLVPRALRRPLATLAAAAVGVSAVVGPAGAASDAGSAATADEPPTMVVLDGPRTSLPWAAAAVAPVAAPEATAAAPDRARPTTVVVQSGEHLWTVAEAELGRRLGRVPTDEETDPYWRALVEANRDRLVDPDNPDLIFSGQQLVLPPTA
jgi:hypothetical protein